MRARGGLLVLLVVCLPAWGGGAILEVGLTQTVEGSFSDIAVDDDGRFYLVDPRRTAVLVLKPGINVPLVEFDLLDTSGRELRDAVSLCILRDGGMAVLDRAGRSVILYGPDGLPRGQFPLGDVQPRAIARDSFDRLVVLGEEGRVLLFGTDGLFLGYLGGGGEDARFFTHPRSLACDDHGNVFVLEGEGGQFTVLNPVGQAKATALARDEGLLFLRDARDVFVDAANFLFVSDAGLDRCLVFSMEGFLGTFGSEGVGEGRFREPVCVASDGNGNVAIADAANRVVQFFEIRELRGESGGALPNWLLPPCAHVFSAVDGEWQAGCRGDTWWAAVSDGALFLAERPGSAPQAEATGEDFRKLSREARVAWGREGLVWVVDPAQGGVWMWPPEAGGPRRVSVPEKSFRPVDLALSPWGDMAVADGREGRIALFDPAGAWSRWLPLPRRSRPLALAFAPDSTAWVGLQSGILLAVDREGTLQRDVRLDRDEFGEPRDLQVDAGGNVVVLGKSSIGVLDPAGASLLALGSRDRGSTRWEDPAALAFGVSDTLWVFEPRQRAMVALGFVHVSTGAIAGAVEPIRDATVWAVREDSRVASVTVTPPSGSFMIADLLPGSYSIDIEGPGLVPLRGLGRASVTRGKIWDVGLWELEVAATVAGRLIPPGGGTEVRLQGEEEWSVLSDESGAFVFNGLSPGSYRLEVDAVGFLPYRSAELAVAAGDSVWVGEVELTSTSAVELRVDAPGAETVWVNLWSSDRGWTTHTGPGDTPLLIDGLEPGEYRLVLCAQGYHPDSSFTSVELAEGERRVLSVVQLTPFPASSGDVTQTVDRGVRAYERADFPSAVSYLQRAVASGQLSYDDQSRALLYLGLAGVALGEENKATSAFREFCLISPGCTLPPEYSSARLEALLEQSRPFQ
jgi:hypothetical protein